MKKSKPFVLQYFILSMLRRNFRKYPAYSQCLNNAKVVRMIPSKKSKKKLRRVFYICAVCKKEFSIKNVAIDHINAVVDPKVGFIDFNTYIERLYCSIDNLQVLCKSHHQEKTNKENKQRRSKK